MINHTYNIANYKIEKKHIKKLHYGKCQLAVHTLNLNLHDPQFSNPGNNINYSVFLKVLANKPNKAIPERLVNKKWIALC